jgi:hypothetical protein
MEKRSRQRVRDQVAHTAFEAETRMRSSARISMMARNTNVPFKGRIQMRKTNHLQIVTFGLQRAAGAPQQQGLRLRGQLLDHLIGDQQQVTGISRLSDLAVLILMTSSHLVGCSMGRSAGFAPFDILPT